MSEPTKVPDIVITNTEDRFWHYGLTYKITFMDGKSIVGKLLAVDRYNVVVRVATEDRQSVDVFCFKHAMARAHIVKEKAALS